jgi:ATP-binding cassette subfamily C protein CydC
MKHWWLDFKPFLPLFRSQLKSMLAGTFLGLLAILSAVGLLSLSGWFIAATAKAGLIAITAKEFNFFLPSIAVRILAITRTLARYGERLISHDATFRILETLRVWFYSGLEPLMPAKLMTYGSGDILSRIVADIDAMDNLYLRVFSPVLAAGVTTLVMVGVFAWVDIGFALIFGLTLGIAGLGVPILSTNMGAGAGKNIVAYKSRLRTLMVEGIQGMAELLVFNIKERYFEKTISDHDKMIFYQRRMAHITGISNALLTMLSGISVFAILWIGADMVAKKEMSGEVLTLAALSAMVAFEAVWPLPAAFQYLSHTSASARRLMEVVNTAPKVVFVDHTIAPPREFDLFLNKVSFRYPETEKWIIKDISLKIPVGSKMAIVGPSGVGKSTLTYLLMRFWEPEKGKIQLGGRNLASISEADLRARMILVSQRSHIFNGTIKSNLLIADESADDNALWQSLSAAQLDTFVRQLPDGLDSWVGEGGRQLSGGQIQRLALARAFLRNAPIWVLDEPTEGLDPDTESKLMDTLFTVGKDCTLIVVTHRKAVMERFEWIVRLERENNPQSLN